MMIDVMHFIICGGRHSKESTYRVFLKHEIIRNQDAVKALFKD